MLYPISDLRLYTQFVPLYGKNYKGYMYIQELEKLIKTFKTFCKTCMYKSFYATSHICLLCTVTFNGTG